MKTEKCDSCYSCANCIHDKEPAHQAPCPECYRNGQFLKFQPISVCTVCGHELKPNK